MKKRLFPILIAMMIVFAMMPMMAGTARADKMRIAYGGLVFEVYDNNLVALCDVVDTNGSWFDRTKGELRIKGRFRAMNNNYTLFQISSRALAGKLSGINKVFINAMVSEISYKAFSDCSDLTSVSLPSGLEYIRECVFKNCKNLKEINIPSSVRKIERYAFSGCDTLTTVHYDGSREQWEAIQGDGKPPIDLVEFAYPTAKPNVSVKGTRIKTLKSSKKAITVKWKKQTAKVNGSHITGYQIQLATNKKFTKNKRSVTVKGYKKVSKKITRLKGKKKYYVRIRTYKTISGKKYYSRWSKTKSKRTR